MNIVMWHDMTRDRALTKRVAPYSVIEFVEHVTDMNSIDSFFNFLSDILKPLLQNNSVASLIIELISTTFYFTLRWEGDTLSASVSVYFHCVYHRHSKVGYSCSTILDLGNHGNTLLRIERAIDITLYVVPNKSFF